MIARLCINTTLGELSFEWGELSSECGASCLLNVGRVVLGRAYRYLRESIPQHDRSGDETLMVAGEGFSGST